MFRTQLVAGDPLRGFTVLSSVDPVLGGPLRLEAAPGHPGYDLSGEPLGSSPDPNRLRMVRAPAGVDPGDYTLICGGIAYGTMTVLAAPPAPDPHRVPDLRAFAVVLDTLRHRPARGPVEITFAPGVYRWSGDPFDLSDLPPGSVLRGNCCRVVNEGTTGTLNALFVNPPDDLTVEDFEFHGAGLTFHSPVLRTGLVVHRCLFAGGHSPAWGYDQALFEGVEFDRSCCSGTPAGLYWNCRWRDAGFLSSAQAFQFDQPTDGGLGVLDCEFRGCGRAVCLFTNNGPIRDCFFVGVRVSGQDRVENGNELLSVEGVHPFDTSLFENWRGWNNCGRLQFWDAPARGNALVGIRLAGPGGILFAGAGGAEQSGNVLDGFELDGGTLAFGLRDAAGQPVAGNVRGNTARNGVIGPPKPSWLNQPMARGWMDPKAPQAVDDANGGNVVEAVETATAADA